MCISKENSKSLKYLNILIKKVVLCIVCYRYVCTDDIIFKEEESIGILKISGLIKINEIYFVKYNSSIKSKLIVNLLDCTNLFSPNTCEKNKKIIGNYS